MTRDELIAALESAERGSRELSDEVLLAFGYRERTWEGESVRGLCGPDERFYGWWRDRPSPTRSVDDALALVPERWYARKIAQWPRHWEVALIKGGKLATSGAATPALALCAAALRTMDKGEG